MIVKKSDTNLCSQSVTLHKDGNQCHMVILNDINNVPLSSMAYIIKNGEIKPMSFL